MTRIVRSRFAVLGAVALFVLIAAGATVWLASGVHGDPVAPEHQRNTRGPDTNASRLAKSQRAAAGVPQSEPRTPGSSPSSATSGTSSALIHAPVPPEGTPWPEVFDALMERARSGDKAASDRLYDKTLDCIQYRLALQVGRARLRANPDAGDMSGAQVARALEGYESLQSILRQNQEVCSSVTRDQLLQHRWDVLSVAARNGNENAAVCYASGTGRPPDGDSGENRAAMAEWKRNALQLMRDGVRRGDWKMVLLLRSYFDPRARKMGSWAVYQFEPDPALAYRYAVLRAIGARVEGSPGDQVAASAVLSGLRQDFDLTESQIRAAEGWAQRAYQQHFAGRPWLGRGTTSMCEHGS